MLGNYEHRDFSDIHAVWLGKYRNLSNVLHWHKECELIRIVTGNAQIKINDILFEGFAGDSFFCCTEDLHYINSNQNTIIEIMIFQDDLAKGITTQFRLSTPKLNCTDFVRESFQRISDLRNSTSIFKNEQLRNAAEAVIIHIFSNENILPQEKRNTPSRDIIEKINEEFVHITFSDMVTYSGYTRSHFSKKFKKLTGIGFAEYLNCIKTENAISLLHQNPRPSMTEICAQCGFSTIRNFNRVFKEITGFSPSELPDDYRMDTDLRVFKKDRFDPTAQKSIQL